MSVAINRDPFARTTLMREGAPVGECCWCGRFGRRWQYYQETDRVTWMGRPMQFQRFCSVGCWRDYHA